MLDRTLIIEVEGFQGEDGSIEVLNHRAEAGEGGTLDRLFCVAVIDESGVGRFVDWGYATVAEARRAWPEASASTADLGAPD